MRSFPLAMFVIPAVAGCHATKEKDSRDRAANDTPTRDRAANDTPTGSAEFIVTDLSDPTGTIEAHWTTDNALWFWSQNFDDWLVNFPTLSEETNQFSRVGPTGAWFTNLQASTRPMSCSEFQERIDHAKQLVADIEEGDSTLDHCEALTEYFEWMDAHTDLHDDLTTFFGGAFETWAIPDPGEYDTEFGTNMLLHLYDQVRRMGDGWDAANCHFTYTQTYSEFMRWRTYSPTLHIDSVDGLVVGSMEGDLRGVSDGGSMHLEVRFEAYPCEYAGGAYLGLSE